MWDILLWMGFEETRSHVSRAYNLKIPAVAQYLKGYETIFIYRSKGKEELKNKAAEIIKRQHEIEQGIWPKLIIYPEGFTSNGKYILPFKVGAF